MFDSAPEVVIGESAFGDQAMNVGIPFKRTTESVKNADKAGNKVFRLVHLMEHAKDNAADSPEEAV